jgi:hypothetical protein
MRKVTGQADNSSLDHAQPSFATVIVRLMALAVALALILFPLGWLGEIWRPFGSVVDALFPTAWEHAIGHASLFCMLGLVALIVVPALRRHPWRYLSLLLLAGLGQEAFQLLYKGRLLLFDDVRDLATDLAGLLLALGFLWGWRRLRGGARDKLLSSG